MSNKHPLTLDRQTSWHEHGVHVLFEILRLYVVSQNRLLTVNPLKLTEHRFVARGNVLIRFYEVK